VAVMLYCRQIGQEVHLSTQLNISNAEALRFYAQFADVVVLARELNMEQVAEIHDSIERDGICGPSGKPVRIEMFCHGALCMAISGKCYLSQSNWGRSANRGECMQLCRRRYTVQDVETGTELDIENRYIMSPKDLKTIRFIDQMVDAGVRVFKIEGRARGPEYVDTVVRCYREAIDTLTDPELGRKAFLSRLDEWDERLARVFNRGFWDGYYLGKTIAEWNDCHGSKATERKVYCGCTVRYYSKLQVAEFKIEACELNVGDEILVTGPTTGALRATVSEIRYDLEPVGTARQGQRISIPVPAKVRPKDKLFVIKKITDNTSA
jgi:putative protease